MPAPVWPRDRLVGLARRVLRAAATLVPFRRRSDWRDEWEGELWALHGRGASAQHLMRFALGGLAHALWERRQEEGMMLGSLAGDTRLALRRLARTPTVTFVTVSVLGLGVGANTALFSALEAALLGAPPYPDADRIVLVDMLLQSRADAPADTMPWSFPKFEMARDQLGSLDVLAGFAPGTVTLTGAGPASRLAAEYVTPTYLEVLGARPGLGRLLSRDEMAPSVAAVALLSHDLWVSRFGADPGVIGRGVSLNGASIEIVGVLDPGFRPLTGPVDLWLPVSALPLVQGPQRLQRPWTHWLRAVGRLRPGVTLEQARADAVPVGRALTRAFPDPDGGGAHGVTMVPFLQARVNPVARAAVTAVSAGALLFLLIACGNVASLLTARASRRRSDVAVRAALGASRRRLVREHLIESSVLAGAGGVLGLVIALGGQRMVSAAVGYALDTSGTRSLQFIDPERMGLDGGMLLLGMGIALATGLVFGMLPAWSAARVSPGADLRASGGATLGSRGTASGDTGTALLVAFQLALTLVLLAGAGLMGASFARLAGVPVGFANTRVLTVAFDRGPGSSPEQDRAFMAALLERLASLPGVTRAAGGTCPPLAGRCEILGLRQVDEQPPKDYSEMSGVLGYTVTEGYFETIGVPTLEGRTFGPVDGRGDAPVVVINETAARTLFPGVSPLGHRLSVTHALTEDRMATVVGVVGDVRYAQLEEAAMPAVYLAERQAALPYGTLFVHATGDPLALLEAVRAEAAALDPDVPLYGASTLAERVAAATARTRIILGLLLAFAASGLLLGALGLYGLVSHAVVRRTREVGLRVALGADRGSVVRMMVGRPAVFALVGAACGSAAAAWLTRYLEGLLFGTTASDPLILAGSAGTLVLVALLAALAPARRAARIEPAAALRVD